MSDRVLGSGDDEQEERIGDVISTKLRACEACKARKIRCDKLAPCSACKSANIPCRSAKNHQEKRQRILISNRFEEQLERINAQLTQLRNNFQDFANSNLRAPVADAAFGTPTPKAVEGDERAATLRDGSSGEALYLGESSFEMHSQQTSQALETVLKNSPASLLDHDTTSALHSLRGILKPTVTRGVNDFNPNLPMPSVQMVLNALRVADSHRSTLFLSAPMLDFDSYKQTVQKVYFPLDGYTMSDFVVTNGALFTIFTDLPESALQAASIGREQAAGAASLCESNVTAVMERLSPFLEPNIRNIEAILVGVHLAISKSKPHVAWLLTSMAARMCLDSGLHRHKSSSEDKEDHKKKSLFWCTYAMDKGLSLNFGRTPTFADFDITIEYPIFPENDVFGLITIWLDLARIQGRIYEKLYSAQGQLECRDQICKHARLIVVELEELRRRGTVTLEQAPPKVRTVLEGPMMDADMMILTNMTLALRVLPTEQTQPLLFSHECIDVARRALDAHQKICVRFTSSLDNSFRVYIDWNLLFCPFTPFIVILGTAILNNSHQDLAILGQVVDSLEDACQRSAGAKRLHDICKYLYRGARSCILQSSVSSTPYQSSDAPSTEPSRNRGPNNVDEHSSFANQQTKNTSLDMFASSQAGIDAAWQAFQLDNADDMSMLFDNYLVGNSTMMGFFDQNLEWPAPSGSN